MHLQVRLDPGAAPHRPGRAAAGCQAPRQGRHPAAAGAAWSGRGAVTARQQRPGTVVHASECPFLSNTSPGGDAAPAPAAGPRAPPPPDPSGLPLPPGSMGLPLLGETAAFLRNRIQFTETRRLQHGKVFKTHLLGRPTVYVSDPGACRRLLAAEHRLVVARWPDAMQRLLGNAFQGDKAKHSAHRKIMGAAFTAEATSSYLPDLQRLVQAWLDRLDSGAGGAGKGAFSGWEECKRLSFEAACKLLVGFDLEPSELEYLQGEFEVFNSGVRFTVPVALPGTPWGKAMAARKNILDVIERKLLTRSRSRSQGPRGGSQAPVQRTVVDLFMEQRDDEGNVASMQDLKDMGFFTLCASMAFLTLNFTLNFPQDMAFFTLYAGHITTSMALAHTLRHLHNAPAALQRLRVEQQQLVQEHGEQVSSSLSMPYTDAVIAEGLRLAGIVQTLYRVALQDLEVGGFRVPQGWSVHLMIGTTMKEVAEWLGDAGAFRPERWLQPGPGSGTSGSSGGGSSASALSLQRAPEGYMPFGAGGRVCLGIPLALSELRAVLSLLARHYHWQLQDPEEPFRLFHEHAPPTMMMTLTKIQPNPGPSPASPASTTAAATPSA